MSHIPGSIFEIRWREVCPWLILVKSLRASLFLRVLAVAWVGVLLTQAGWFFIGRVSGEPVKMSLNAADASAVVAADVALAGNPSETSSNAHSAVPVSAEQSLASWSVDHAHRHALGPLVEGWRWLAGPLVRIFRGETSFSQFIHHMLCGLWAIFVWGIAGGAIARIAAVFLARDEQLGLPAALTSAATKWTATCGAPIIGLLLAALLAFPLAAMGILARTDVLALVIGFVWGLYLFWGILLALVLAALWFGWPLAWSAIAVERSDAFDAASRAAAYVYQRPLRLIFYVIVASVLGFCGQMVVSGLAKAGSELTHWSVSWAQAWSERQHWSALLQMTTNQSWLPGPRPLEPGPFTSGSGWSTLWPPPTPWPSYGLPA